MNITVINGTEKRGVTCRLTELFLEPFRETAEITRYDLPRDCPGFCAGCAGCVLNGEQTCKDAAHVQKIAASLLEADLIVMSSPAYVFHTTGAMKALLDHLAYLWMPHRPAPEMFGKRALVITQCLGAGGKSAAKDIADSLSWWGISHIRVWTGRLMGGIEWDGLPEKKRSQLTGKIGALAETYRRVDYARPARTRLPVKFKFFLCRMMKRSLYQVDPEPPDTAYWAERGWLERGRPWRRTGKPQVPAAAGLSHAHDAQEEHGGE